MECPFCTTQLPDDDVFCEACGKPLHSATASPAACNGCTCGATPEEIDEEGYCGRCGRLARRPASDHIEIVVSPDFAGVSDRGLHHPRNEDRFAIRQVFNGDAANSDVAHGEAANGEAASGNPANGNPANANPANGDPANANPANGSPANANPASDNPTNANPANANPASGDPANANPAHANPAHANPANANSANANPASGNPASGFVLVVCDGVSSSRNSEVASSSVAENVANSLEASLRRHSASSPERTVRSAIYDAQTRLIADAASTEDAPSTTVVAALVKGADVTIGWAGDSRAYWIGADGETRQLTTDHSWLSEIVAAGVMSAEEAEKAPMAHGITRWLGADAGENAAAAIVNFKIPGRGHLLLCTDGLWNYAEQPGQLSALFQPGDAIDTARRLVDYANAQGGHDNITAVLLSYGTLKRSPAEGVNMAADESRSTPISEDT